MHHGHAEGRAVGSVPEPRGLVHAPGEDGLAVGAERHGYDLVLMHHGQAAGWPSAAFQSRAVLSALPVRMVLPSGLNATAQIQS